MYLIPLILVVLFKNISSQNYTETENLQKKSESGFLLVIPRTLIFGRNESVCLTLHEIYSTTKIVVDLKIKEKHYMTTRDVDAEHTCFELTVPTLNYKEPHFANIQVQIKVNNTVETVHNQDPIIIYPNKPVTFIYTDRKIYKPGDKIRIRVLVLNRDLQAIKKYKIPTIKIKNPFGITVSIWENVHTELGLVHLEYQLSQQTSEGKWTVDTNSEEKVFEVRRYILPRFKVSINHPKIIYTESKNATFTICAQYSYGQKVEGSALIKISDSVQNMKPISRFQKMDNGCTDFVFTSQDLYLHQLRDDSYLEANSYINGNFPEKMKKLYIVATVTESGTNQVEFATAKSIFSFDLYELKFLPSTVYFQPGLPYYGVLKLTNVQKDGLKDEIVEVCYTIAVKRSWNVQQVRPCSNVTIGANNTVNFTVLPFKPNVIQFYLHARSVNRTNIKPGFLSVYRLHSTNGNYVTLSQNEDSEMDCSSSQHLTVTYTVNRFNENQNVTFYYMIKSRGRIYKLRKIVRQAKRNNVIRLDELKNTVGEKHKFIKLGAVTDSFDIKFKLDEKIITNYEILVYYILDNGEVIATSREVPIKSCLLNSVETQWSEDDYRPGDTAILKIKTSPKSLCSISVVDKSTSFVTSSEKFNLETLLKPFMKANEPKETTRLTCIQHMRKTALPLSEPYVESTTSEFELKRRKRMAHLHAEDLDVYNVFNQYGITTITNLKIITKPCYEGPVILDRVPLLGAQFYTRQYFAQNDDKTLQLRHFFPETWIWDLIPVSKDGKAYISREIPHTITNWMSNALCVSPTDGVGLSETVEVRAFQPFFVDILTPYSIRRDEIMHLHVKVFNYLNYSMPIKITLLDLKLERLGDLQQEQSVIKCVESGKTFDHVYLIKGRELGKLNITVAAELESSYPDECGPEFVINKRDVVSKIVLVEPEGFPVENTYSALLCSNGTNSPENVTWELRVPHQLVVSGTENAKVVFNADLLGNTIENLEELLTIPTGCGEQIMATMAPNLYILRYLNASGKLSPITRQRAIRNVKIGYQRILAYMHKDGSFSAFGTHDPSGSMFLTTFVLRTLAQAKAYIYVDENVLNKALKWIIDHQLENGCFAAMHHVFQDMGGASKENSTAALTAYVIISLIEAEMDFPESVGTNAKFCIRGHTLPDKYTLAISTYALFLVKWDVEANKYIEKLIQTAVVSRSAQDTAVDIEIMSYTLLSLLYQENVDNMAYSHQIVRWLSSKRGSQGGFKTTQDTVVALDALAKYALKTNTDTDLKIKLAAKNQDQEITINENDRLKSKRVNLLEADNNVHVNARGVGCVLVQAILSYNVYRLPQNQAFNLAIDVIPASTADKCSVANINPCLAYVGPDSLSNMAVLEVGLPSGYEPDRTSLYRLVDASNSKVKMFEERKNDVVLYFTRVTDEHICAPFIINENSAVQGRKNSSVKLYDYYRPENEISMFYKLNSCDTENLPALQLNAAKDGIAFAKNTKRNADLNPDFVDKDHEMQIPEGQEGNVPMFTVPEAKQGQTNVTDNVQNAIDRH